MKAYSVSQKCSSILNLNLVPAFRSKSDYTVLHSDKLKPLNNNETGVSCSTLILPNVARQRDMTKCCLLTVNNRKRQREAEKKLEKSPKWQLFMDFQNKIGM